MQLVHSAEFSPRSPTPPITSLSDIRALRAKEPTWSIHVVARQLGADRSASNRPRSDRWLATYVQGLIETQNFPRPLPTLHAGAVTTQIVPSKSRWLSEAVRAWLDGYLPPEAVAARETEAERDAADRMDAAADNLFGRARA